jgi:formamidopyrimidine-DNA glycosylase
MPELPEVAVSIKYFEKWALGRKIASVRVKDARIVRELAARELEEELTGRTFTATRQHGKYFFARSDDGQWLIAHFGMNGYLRYFEVAEDAAKFDRVLIAFETGGFLAYANPRMLGGIGLTQDPDGWIGRKGLGPSALDPRLDYREFQRIFSGRTGEIKSALMNQKLVAGIGNIYSDEILLQSRVHPRTKVDTLGARQRRSIFDNLKKVLQAAIAENGDGWRLPQGYILRNRRKGAACPVCGATLETAGIAGRTSYFCPRCQKEAEN